jgi:acyl dehydratase
MEVGERFERRVLWTREDIAAFAREVGDTNPLHHDEAYARASRFGGPIASGAHTVAFLMALCGAQASAERPGVGLEFSFRLLGPARPDEEIVFRWEIIARERSERLRGDVCTLRGEALGRGARPLVSATATILMQASQ